MKVFLTTLALIGTIAIAIFWGANAEAATLLFPTGGGTGRGTLNASQLLYGNGTSPVSTVATTTLSGTGVTSVSNSPFLIGASPAVISLIGGTGGQILTWANGAANWVASTTFSAPLVFSAGNVTCTNASSGVTGCLTGTDWNTFNSKQASGNYITALTGDVTATGPNSVAATLATVNTDVGSFTNANITVNGKGLITAASSGSAGGATPYEIATTSTIAVPQLAYFTQASGRTTLGGVATTTLSGGSQVAVSNSPVVLGATPAVLSIVADSIGDTQLAFNTGQNLTTASSPTFAGATIGTLSGLIKGTSGVLSAATAGTDYLATYDAFTHPVSGYSATTSGMGVGTSTNWAFFGVNPLAGIASRSFVVGSSSATLFEIENDGRVGIGTSTIGTGLMGQLNIESGSSNTSTYNTGSVNGFLEVNVQNRNTGNAASSDLVATADNGSATAHYINLGINGSGGGGTPFTTANHSYLYSVDDPLNIGALGSSNPFITVNVGGGASPIERARWTLAGYGIGTSTPRYTLTLASSTRPALAFDSGRNGGDAQFTFRQASSTFYISTSSPITWATTTPAILAFDSVTASTTLQKLSVDGTATSTFTGGLQIKALTASRVVFTDAIGGLNPTGASAALLNSLSDETGTGVAVFGTSPTFTTSIAAVPLISGGAAVGSTLAIQGTSGASPTTATLTLRAASTISPSMTFTTRGIGAGTTTPAYLFNLASSTAPQLALSDGSITAAPWTFRSGNGNFYLATGSPTTFATTSNATLNNPFTIIAGGISGLFGFASSTPWANVGITSTAGIPALAIGSTTQTSFLIDSFGRTSIGSSSPWARFTMDKFLGVASSSITVAQYNPATSTSQSVDCRDSNTIFVSLGTGATTITLAPMVGGQSCVVALQNPNATAGAVTWSTTASQKLFWPSAGAVPTQTTTANKVDLWSFKAIAYPTSATSTPQTIIMGAQTPNFGP